MKELSPEEPQVPLEYLAGQKSSPKTRPKNELQKPLPKFSSACNINY